MIDLLFINIFTAIFFQFFYFPGLTKLDFLVQFLPMLINPVGPLQSFFCNLCASCLCLFIL